MTVVLSIVLSVVTSVAVVVVVVMAVSMIVVVVVAVSMIVSMAARRFTTKVEMAIARVQNFHLNQVKDEAHHCNDEHDVSLDLRWFKEAHRRLIEQPSSHHPNGGDRDKGADDLSSVPTVGKIVRCRLL